MGVASYAGVPRYRKRHPHASIESRVIDTPQSAINLDSGLVRPSESRMCSWCLDNGHPALEWSLSKGTKKSLVAKARGDGLYRCERCEAINTHLTKIRPRPADYGFSRKDTPSSTPRPPPKCNTCGEIGHIARACRKSVCYNCGRLGHHASTCTNPMSCYVCGNAHSHLDCPESRDIRARGSNDA